MKDWGDSASELMIVKKQLQETVHTIVLLVCFTFCTRCNLIGLGCFIPRFKLSLGNCCWLTVCIVVVVLGVLVYVYLLYYMCIAVITLDAGLHARSKYSENPANGHLETGFSWFPCA